MVPDDVRPRPRSPGRPGPARCPGCRPTAGAAAAAGRRSDPGWVREVDVVVIGSGIAGLTAALECRDLGQVMVVTKDVVAAGSTHWAQGGIASVQAEGDTVEQHVDDTLVAGAGLCIEEAVRVLVSEGPGRGGEADRPRGRVRPRLRRRAGADPRGRPPPQPDRPRRRRRHRGRDRAGAGRHRDGRPGDRDRRARPGPGPDPGRGAGRASRRRSPVSPCTCSARAPGAASARCTPGPSSWPPAASGRSTP